MKDQNKIKQQKKERRHCRIRVKISGAEERPRLSIFRSLNHIYVQVINDNKGATLLSANDQELKEKEIKGLKKTEIAKEVGNLIAQKALEKGIKKVVFDRGGYKYHGRIKALAEGAREGGLEF